MSLTTSMATTRKNSTKIIADLIQIKHTTSNTLRIQSPGINSTIDRATKEMIGILIFHPNHLPPLFLRLFHHQYHKRNLGNNGKEHL